MRFLITSLKSFNRKLIHLAVAHIQSLLTFDAHTAALAATASTHSLTHSFPYPHSDCVLGYEVTARRAALRAVTVDTAYVEQLRDTFQPLFRLTIP